MFQHIACEIDVASLSQDNEIASVVQSIQHHEHEILTLRKHLNPLLPAARIPDDILVEIFYHSIWISRHHEWEYSWSYGTESKEYSGGPGWWSVPLVCQRWRNLVMSHPRLWSFMASRDRPEYVHRAIELSANAGLSLRLFSPEVERWSHNSGIFQELLEQLPQAYLLECQFKPYLDKSKSPVDIPRSLPRVQTLYLRSNRKDYSHEDGNHADPLAQSLVAASLPRLETLILANAPAYLLGTLKHPTITSLEIDNGIIVEPSCRKLLELGTLVDALANLPLLRVFRLRVLSLLDKRRNSFEVDRVKIHFSHLQDLKFHTDTKTCLRLLSLISFRPQANVSIFTASVPRSSTAGTGRIPVKLTAQIMERLKVLQYGHWSPPYRLTLANEEERNYYTDHSSTNYKAQLSSQSGHTLDFQVPRDHIEGRDCVIHHLPLQDIETIELHSRYHNLGSWFWPQSRNITNADIKNHWTRTIAASSLLYSGPSYSCCEFLRSLADSKCPDNNLEGFHFQNALPHVRSLTLVGIDSEDFVFITLRKALRKRRMDGAQAIEELVWRQNENQEPKFTRSGEAALLRTLQDMNVKVTLDLPVQD